MENNTFLIGITGAARSGKDTIADMLVKHLSAGFGRYSFATPIKDMIHAGLKVQDKDDNSAQALYDCSYRKLAQTLGTEWGRDLIHPDIWVKIAAQRLYGKRVIISDVRFENEAECIRDSGILIHVVRPDQEKIKEADHISEAGVQILHGDYKIINEGSLTDLANTIKDRVIPMILLSMRHENIWGMNSKNLVFPAMLEEFTESKEDNKAAKIEALERVEVLSEGCDSIEDLMERVANYKHCLRAPK